VDPGIDTIVTKEETWRVYILECADGTLYTGVAIDLERRLRQHNGERPGGPKYTRGRRPVRVLWSASAADRSEAQQREAAIKKLSRADKFKLLSY
jgi:putative endonuclease